MSKPVYYQLPNGQWRVTEADDSWREDGVTYPESKLTDQYFDLLDDARAAWDGRRVRQPGHVEEPVKELRK